MSKQQTSLRKNLFNRAIKLDRDFVNHKFRRGERKYYYESPIFAKGTNLPQQVTQDYLDSEIKEFVFKNSGAKYGMKHKIKTNDIFMFAYELAKGNDYSRLMHKVFNRKYKGLTSEYVALYVYYSLVNFNLSIGA